MFAKKKPMSESELNIRLIGMKENKSQSRINHWELLRFDGKGSVDVSLSTGFDADPRSRRVVLTIGAHYTVLRSQIWRRLLDYVMEAEFEITVDNQTDESAMAELLVSQDLLKLMLNIAIGGMRGMIALRTAGSALDGYPLPLYNINELIERIVASSESVA